VIQPVGIIFKGSGFYVTDNRQGSSPTLAPPKDKDKDKDKEGVKAAPENKTTTAEGSSKETKSTE
jgi:predicted nucleic acid-binding Zn ribbon protein